MQHDCARQRCFIRGREESGLTVLVNALDLDVDQGVPIHGDAERRLDVVAQAVAVVLLTAGVALLEAGVLGVLAQPGELVEVRDPLLAAESLSDELRQRRVALEEPATRRDTVRDVREVIAAEELDKVGEQVGLDEVGVERSDTVDLVRADDGEVGHADRLREALLDERHAGEAAAVARELLLDVREEERVQIEDDFCNNVAGP